jgi:acetolactate synthase-1/2/3 large subunit
MPDHTWTGRDIRSEWDRCASLERAPLIVFTDSNPAGAAGRFRHQQIDQLALMAPIVKWSGRLMPDDAPAAIDRAFRELATLPPGPVHLDCPGDAFGAGADLDRPGAGPRSVGDAAPSMATDSDGARRFESMVARARRPLLLIGLGARSAGTTAAVRQLCERRSVPAMVTYKAKGVVPDSHPCFAGCSPTAV